METHKLSEKWIKASIAGTIWAASEIVLGSFLHNLRIPFSGNILTAIGLIILISISYIWNERGIYWRAGLICALMKAMSPSAVIFGPMIAIFTESLLLELSVRFLGRNYLGFAIGSMLAMSWNLIQKILNFIIFYGTNIIEIYSNLLRFAQKQLNIKSDIVWMPIIILLVLYALFGLLSSFAGMKTGKRLLNSPAEERTATSKLPAGNDKPKKIEDFNYSVVWLFLNITLIITSFILLNATQWFVWSIFIISILFVWAFRYKRALRQLSKPGFWLLFVVITLLTAFAFTKAGPGENAIIKGLMTGVQMNFRAALMIVGFSVLGTELYNPTVRKFFLKSSFKSLPLALELSAESLPMFIAGIPDFRHLFKDPVSVFSKVIANAETRLQEIRRISKPERKIFLVTGSIRGGKTTFIKRVISAAAKKNITTAGILSEIVTDESGITGYDIVQIETGRKIPFLRLVGQTDDLMIGRFHILRDGLEAGREILHELASSHSGIIIIDEAGMLELQDGGWSGNVTELLGNSCSIMITVRDIFLERIKEKWNIQGAIVIDVNRDDPEALLGTILK